MKARTILSITHPVPEGHILCSHGTTVPLVFTPEASAVLLHAIGWGREDYPENRLEQGGRLVGRYIRDADGKINQAEVTHVFVAEASCRLAGYIEWDGLEEIRLQRLFFEIQDKMRVFDPAGAEALVLIGWWHTHPNGLAVFMSGTDMENQKIKCPTRDKYSVVLNPHRMEWRAYAGPDAVEVPAVMLLQDTTAANANSDVALDKASEKPAYEDSRKKNKVKKVKTLGKKHRRRVSQKGTKKERKRLKKLLKKRKR